MAKKKDPNGGSIRVSKRVKSAFARHFEWEAKNPKANKEEQQARFAKHWFEECGMRPALADLVAALAYETDRGCVIVSAALVNDDLEHLLRVYFSSRAPGSESVVDSLFVSEDRSIPMLQGTSIKIKLAYVLGLIDDELRKACAKIQHMRSNVYAHSRTPRYLKHKEAVAILLTLKSAFPGTITEEQAMSGKFSSLKLNEETPRASFVIATMAVLAGLEIAIKKAKRLRPRQPKSGSKA